jgi:ABC-type dipeptide/oligopeptide/nickel transport system permease component
MISEDHGGGVVESWDLDAGIVPEGNSDLTSTLTVYLWGFLVVFAIALAIGGWGKDKAGDRGENLKTYMLMGLLWPLFVSAVLFVILWTVLTRRKK